MNPPRLHDPSALLNRLAASFEEGREVVFLVGSPLTAPTASGQPGVPGVAEMVRRARAALGDCTDLSDPDEPGAYQEAFGHLHGHLGLEKAKRLVREAVLEACIGAPPARLEAARDGDSDACKALEDDPRLWALSPGAAHLGRLVAGWRGICCTVLTSNFDPLVEISVRKAGSSAWWTALHGDGSLELSEADGCHVIHLHGFWRGDIATLHTPEQLGQPRPQLAASLRRLFERALLCVVAYDGWDDVFTRTLGEFAADTGAPLEILWAFHAEEPDAVARRYGALLGALGPGVGRGAVTLYGGVDCHELFEALEERLEPQRLAAPATLPATAAAPGRSPAAGNPGPTPAVAAPGSPFVVGPAVTDDAGFFGRERQREELRDALLRCQPVQILGERRMGKTSLLRWVERHAGELQHRPVAWVNAQGLPGRSPVELVRGAARSLGRLAEVETLLTRHAALPDARAAEPALAVLLPAVFLIDEAEALSEPSHGFDTEFLDHLRALGQDGELVWISTSRVDLHPLFRSTGLTSKFLNDARRLWVGQLEPEAARALLLRALGEEAAAAALEEAGGFAYGLQWMGEALWRGQAPEAARDRFADAAEPIFRGWWRRCSEDERRLLRGAVEGLAITDLDRRDRRRARALVEWGFLVEEEGEFLVPGAAWREWVGDARA